MLKKIASLFLFCFPLLGAFTDANAQETWSLKKCLDHAYQNNLQIKQQMLNEQIAESSLRKSYASSFPVLNAYANQGFNFGRAIDPYTNEITNERVGFQDLYINGEVVIFNGFQKMNQMRYNVHNLSAVKYDSEQYKNDLTLMLAAAYLQILYNDEMLEISKKQTEISRQQLERTKGLLEAGTMAKGALLEIEAQLANDELAVVKAENNLRLSYLELIHLLDLDPSVPFSIEKPEINIESADALMELNTVINYALENDPSVKASESRIFAAEKMLSVSKSLVYPSLSLYGTLLTGYSDSRKNITGTTPTGEMSVIGFTSSNNEPVYTPDYDFDYETIPYREQIHENFRQNVGLSLRIPIFNGYEYRNQVQNAKIGLDNARLENQIKRNNLNKTIQQAYADALSSLQKYQATEKSLSALEEAFTYTRQRFDLGMVNSLEFNESKNKVSKAESELIQAKFDFVFRMKVLEFYAGKPISI